MSSVTKRYVQRGQVWVPEYTVGSGLGDRVARSLYRLGFQQDASCGCPKRQAWLNRLGGAADRMAARVPYRKGSRFEGPPPIAGGSGGNGPTSSFLNCVTSEPTVNGAATTIMCDDFDSSRDVNNNVA